MRSDRLRERYGTAFLVVIVAAVIAGVLFVVTGHPTWDAYGPNLVASMVEVGLTAGVLQLILDAQRRRREEPLVRLANGQARRLLEGVIMMLEGVIVVGGVTTRPATLEALADEWRTVAPGVDLNRSAETLPARTLGVHLGASLAELRALEATTAPTVAAFASMDLATALRELFETRWHVWNLYAAAPVVSDFAQRFPHSELSEHDYQFLPTLLRAARAYGRTAETQTVGGYRITPAAA
jgi:hypothetical protein